MSDKCPTCGGKVKIKRPLDRINGLTPAQWKVAELIYRGLSNKEIAAELNLAVRGVISHTGAIRKTWGVSSRTQVMLKMIALKKSTS